MIPLLSLTTSIIIMVVTVSGFIYNTRCNLNLPDTSYDTIFSEDIFVDGENIKKHDFKDRNYSF